MGQSIVQFRKYYEYCFATKYRPCVNMAIQDDQLCGVDRAIHPTAREATTFVVQPIGNRKQKPEFKKNQDIILILVLRNLIQTWL